MAIIMTDLIFFCCPDVSVVNKFEDNMNTKWKTALILLLFTLALPHLEAEGQKVQILSLKGKVSALIAPTHTHIILKEGDFLPQNIIIKTGAQARVLLLFPGGVRKLILPDSIFSLQSYSEKKVGQYKQIEKIFDELRNMQRLGATKANKSRNKVIWKGEGPAPKKRAALTKIALTLLNEKEYSQIVVLLAPLEKGLEETSLVFILAQAYLLLGLPEKSAPLFEQLLIPTLPQIEEQALIGRYLSLWAQDNYGQAKVLVERYPEILKPYEALLEKR